MKEYVVHLTPEERTLLEDMRSKGVHRSKEICRAAILLKSESGLTDTVIAEDAGGIRISA